jgi:hypothetical protein
MIVRSVAVIWHPDKAIAPATAPINMNFVICSPFLCWHKGQHTTRTVAVTRHALQ